MLGYAILPVKIHVLITICPICIILLSNINSSFNVGLRGIGGGAQTEIANRGLKMLFDSTVNSIDLSGGFDVVGGLVVVV